MFIDERVLDVTAGSGGNGAVAWRREKFVPFGGPGGGDGGDGGDVVLVAETQLTTFRDMEQVQRLRGQDGRRGLGDRKSGPRGAARIYQVPVGTTVYDETDGTLLVDLLEAGQRYGVARGGKGGRGNARFASATDQRPMQSEPGTPGERRRVRLELRLLADVGLLGLPNAGKSTLLSRVTAATPKVADYPFTTLEPYLGIVELPDGRRFVMADLPGLIEGASQGKGLGDRFLRHLERTRVLVHLVDVSPLPGVDPVAAWRTVRGEVEAYGHGLAERREIVVPTKIDTWPEGPELESMLSRLAAAVDREVLPISAVTGKGVPALLRAVAAAVAAADPAPGPPARRARSSDAPPDGGPEAPGCSKTSSSTSR